MDHIRGVLSTITMTTTLPLSLPMLGLGATFPRTQIGSILWKSGNKLLNGRPVDGVTADEERRKVGTKVESDEILRPDGGANSER